MWRRIHELLLHTADLHIGAFGGRHLKYANLHAFEKIVEYALTEDIGYVVIAGDLFEKPRIENYELLLRVIKGFRMLRDNSVYTVVVPGSHDSSISRQDLLAVLEHAGLVNIPRYHTGRDGIMYLEPLKLGDLVFYGLPGLRNNRELEYLESRRLRFKDLDTSRVNVFIAHTSVKFAGYDPEKYYWRYSKAVIAHDRALMAIPGTVKYIALGHIHYPIPLFHEAEGNIAYPGTPVGRDMDDLLQTYKLRQEGWDRRFLLVDVYRDKPLMKSIFNGFGVEIAYDRIVYTSEKDVLDYAKKLARDLGGEFKVVLMTIDKLPRDKYSTLIQELSRLEREYKTVFHIRETGLEEVFLPEITLITPPENREELELAAIRDFVSKKGLKIEPEKIKAILDIVGEERTSDVKKTEFIEKLYKDIEPILEEIVDELPPQQHS